MTDHNINDTPGNHGNHNRILAKMYFDQESKNAEGKVKCRKCETCKDNSGHGNLASHVKQKHASCWEEELKQHLEGPTRNASGGSMDAFVTISNVVSDQAKNINSWIEWIVLANLPIIVVENEHYRKHTTLKPTTYKTISKYMTKLLEIVLLNIQRVLPKTFGLIFDGNLNVYY